MMLEFQLESGVDGRHVLLARVDSIPSQEESLTTIQRQELHKIGKTIGTILRLMMTQHPNITSGSIQMEHITSWLPAGSILAGVVDQLPLGVELTLQTSTTN